MTDRTWNRCRGLAAALVLAQGQLALAEAPSPAASPPTTSTPAGGESNEESLFELDQALKAETRVASQKAKTIRETPGIVTLITREEIQESGARDLIDILRLVPGFEFAGDVENTVSMTFRGNDADSGKILLLIDGIDQTDDFYMDVILGNHFPIQSIQKIEIIRGGGSVLYGADAEYAVINIVTRSAEEVNGLEVSGLYGQMEHSLGQADLNLNYGQTFLDENLKLTFSGLVGAGDRSDQRFTDFSGVSTFMGRNMATDPLFLNAGVEYKKFILRLQYDDYRLTDIDGYGPTSPLTFERWTAFRGLAQTDIKVGPLTITPRMAYDYERPWQVISPASSNQYYSKELTKWDARVVANWPVTADFNAMLGLDGYMENASLIDPAQYPNLSGSLFGTNTSVEYHDLAGFGEVSWDTPFVDVLAGLRYEYNSAVGSSLVPRAALTKAFGPVHAKLLYSQSFRAPGIEELNSAVTKILPERTTLYEAEIGYRFAETLFLTANVFDMLNTNALVYYNDPVTGDQTYQNFSQTGTAGFEVSGRYEFPRWVDITANYSFYNGNQNQVPTFAVPGHRQSLLGSPTHKIVGNAVLHLWRGLSLDPSVIWESAKWGYLTGDGQGDGILGETQAGALVNLFLRCKDLVKGLEVGVGVYNLLDFNYVFVQAYNAGHPPLPGPSRDYELHLTYNLPAP